MNFEELMKNYYSSLTDCTSIVDIYDFNFKYFIEWLNSEESDMYYSKMRGEEE